MLNKFIWIMSVLTQQCRTYSSAKTNIYTFMFVLGMFVWSFHFLKACLDKKESPAVYILANVTLRERTVLVWGVKLCTYCSLAAAPQITCWRLKASEGYFFQNKEEEPQTNEGQEQSVFMWPFKLWDVAVVHILFTTKLLPQRGLL